MQTSVEPQPLTRLNVTKHDRIWDTEVPKNFFGFDNSNTLFSPPLKHITPETTEELWEKFDPLDLLIDSASEKSVKTESSTDTMIMMTSEELRKNEERIKSSFMEYENRKNVKAPLNKNFVPPKYSEEQNDLCNNNSEKNAEEDLLNDEGYGTDSRTNTTASLSSPLSSSLSSLLTSESSSSQGSLQRNSQSISRPQHIPSNGRLVVGNRQNIVAKKKVQPVEKQDNSLMDRLRALTTIQEEESAPSGTDSNLNHVSLGGESSRSVCEPWRSYGYVNDRGQSSKLCHDPSQGYSVNDLGGRYLNDRDRYANEVNRFDQRKSDEGYNNSGHYMSAQKGYKNQTYLEAGSEMFPKDGDIHDGIFRAVPVKIAGHLANSVNGQYSEDQMSERNSAKHAGPDAHLWNGNLSHSDFRTGNTEVSDTSTPRGVIPPKLSKRSSYMYSMPNLANDNGAMGASNGHVVMRRPKSNMNQNPRKPDFRYSWDCTDLQNPRLQGDAQNLNNIHGHNDEAPKLGNQFRASSEMALPSGRPLFAPSSDIYKLFQGQGRAGFSHGKNPSHRHSFHAMPSQTTFSLPPTDPSMDDMRKRLRAASSQGTEPLLRVKNGPVKASHDLYKQSNIDSRQLIRQPKPRPNSMVETKEKLSTLV